jgi:hypothetical protein
MSQIAEYMYLGDGAGGHPRYARESELEGLRKLARRQPGRVFKRGDDGKMSEVENLGSQRDAGDLIKEYRNATKLRMEGEARARRANAASNVVARITTGASGGGS